jgi:transcription-repair coupling factor (superfamily II helicase)
MKQLPAMVNVDLPLSIGFPEEYIPDQNLRLRLYRRLADLRLVSEIEPLKAEFQDRFGKMPEEVTNLFYQIEVKLLAEKAGLTSISVEGRQFVLRFPAPAQGSQSVTLPKISGDIRAGKNAYWMEKDTGQVWMQKLVDTLHQIIENNQ